MKLSFSITMIYVFLSQSFETLLPRVVRKKVGNFQNPKFFEITFESLLNKVRDLNGFIKVLFLGVI